MTRLYHVPLSPFCRKVRLTLAEKKVEVELVEERFGMPGRTLANLVRRFTGGQARGDDE